MEVDSKLISIYIMPGTLLSILQALEHLLTEIVALVQTDFFLRFLFYVHRCFARTCVHHMSSAHGGHGSPRRVLDTVDWN